jgi:hypothetical protein
MYSTNLKKELALKRAPVGLTYKNSSANMTDYSYPKISRVISDWEYNNPLDFDDWKIPTQSPFIPVLFHNMCRKKANGFVTPLPHNANIEHIS